MPSFARDPGTAAYYEQRAAEYDEWYESLGRFAARLRPGWDAEVDDLCRFVHALEPARTLDVACGSGFLTRHLRGFVVALDQSPSMVALTQRRLRNGIALRGDALDLPFADDAFERVFTGHFYGHLPPAERATFLGEARRVARELIVVDTALRPGEHPEQQQERILNDGSRHHVFKRFLTVEQLADEIGGQPVLTGDWFVAAASSR
ncbi:class I SAM-dependent methyltransferase [Cryptosporangium sp. NPDC048952]|uniref:class I SAM-dependent methyltransferase n=1 Tax=Cryptosporangium sp. NPDC048952 TaxID=3363961 RepID=UPI00371C5027